jgi:glycosidase
VDEKLLGFHISRQARDSYQFDDDRFAYRGQALIPNFQVARSFANRINQKRDISNFPNEIVQASQINALALIQGITHYILQLYLATRPQLMSNVLTHLRQEIGSDSAERTLLRFIEEFQPQPVYHRELDPQSYLVSTYDTRPNREVTLEELTMLWLSNVNPAFEPFSELFDDELLKKQTAYNRITLGISDYFAQVAKNDPGDAYFPAGVSIIDILMEPIRQSPYSLEGQLKVLMEEWGTTLGSYLYRLLTTIDVLKEDSRPLLVGPGFGQGGDSWKTTGESIVPYYDPALYDLEFENFTQDRAWMPNLVLIAKNAYVWLDQLSKKYQRSITTLDQVPDEELDQLARWGFTGLWLIGLWERSEASKTIKQITGNQDAVASAYSLKNYNIASKLGGDEACRKLQERAWKRGIRLASDMVPNHMGIDSDWVMEHPNWFLSLDYSPYPNYTFNGVNLSWNPRVGIYLEDHYYDRTDAAVVFKRVDFETGDTKYIYHGNDGTSMPWNDTAQLNYLMPEVREAMVQVILDIAKRFPIIRFDAAMTLVKKHIQRLWFPEPGTGGAIASRSEHGMTRPDFERLMPEEFWREVIDRAAVEAPDTLLLAEAFWLLESYFVRTLGMHRVYNSAYMNMMRDEENSKYRQLVKNTLEFDPEILKRYVNFMNNPDEKTAVEQFGKGDKYFGICMVLLTMPGLPMIGHGQVEGFAEKYGMEYYRAYWEETPDQYLIQRHERELFPLMKKRYLFAGVEEFLFYDYQTEYGLDENVFAYSNRVGNEMAVLLYNNSYHSTSGTIKRSVMYSMKADGDTRVMTQKTLGEGLGLSPEAGQYLIFRDHRSGMEYIRPSYEISQQGLYTELAGYQYMALLDFRVVQDNENGQYQQLAANLAGRGVPSIDNALLEMMVEPVRAPFWSLINDQMVQRFMEVRRSLSDSSEPDDLREQELTALLDDIEQKMYDLMDAVEAFTGAEDTAEGVERDDEIQDEDFVDEDAAIQPGSADRRNQAPEVLPDHKTAAAQSSRELTEALMHLPLSDTPKPILDMFEPVMERTDFWGGILTLLYLSAIGTPIEVRSWIDEWLLSRVIDTMLRSLGANEQESAQTIAAIKLSISLPEMFAADDQERADRLLEMILQEPDAQQFLNINAFQGTVWFNREGFTELMRWLVIGAQLFAPSMKVLEQRYISINRLNQAMEQSAYQLDKLREATRRPEAVTTRSSLSAIEEQTRQSLMSSEAGMNRNFRLNGNTFDVDDQPTSNGSGTHSQQEDVDGQSQDQDEDEQL